VGASGTGSALLTVSDSYSPTLLEYGFAMPIFSPIADLG
jgi:hypothetical protein